MKTKVLTAILATAFLGITSVSFAQPGWKARHPRRAEVNHRLNHQDKRVDDKVADGKMSKAEANNIDRKDQQVRKEEKLMASQDHGHITRQEKKTLNQQENKISTQIKNQ
jgi:hypothetical protein